VQGPPAGVAPPRVTITNTASAALKAAARAGELQVVWQDCRKWPGVSGECASSIHYIGVDATAALNGTCGCVARERVFGLRNEKDDPAGSVVYYGNPAVEVNKNNDVVVVYNRSGFQVPFEARYSAYIHGETDIRPSAVLKSGTFPALNGAKMDTAGVSVDPFNDTGVWMINGYSYPSGPGSSFYAFAFGKVFGGVFPDITVDNLSAALFNATVKLQVHVANHGDGAAARSAGLAYLRHPGRGRVLLGKLSVPALRPAGSHSFVRSFRLPPGASRRGNTIEVVVRGRGREYGTANNTLRSALVVRR
jgi:hypothetical protein